LYHWPDWNRVIVGTRTDYFHSMADPWRPETFCYFRQRPHLYFIIPTKRPERIAQCLPYDWGEGYPNVALGITAQNQEWYNRRWPYLRDVQARYKFIAYEPAMSRLVLSNDFLQLGRSGWVIVGGLTGRKLNGSGGNLCEEFALSVFDQCQDANVPFWFTRWGGIKHADNPPILRGELRQEHPFPTPPLEDE
jgi:protein gp37